jgi:hypothetical protein
MQLDSESSRENLIKLRAIKQEQEALGSRREEFVEL